MRNRVLIRPFGLPPERVKRVTEKVMLLNDSAAEKRAAEMLASFEPRHRNFREYIRQRYETMAAPILTDAGPISENRKLLIGSYFACEYSLEAAALFNPSIVWHPDQSGVVEGERRFVMSLRSTGEGHISSISFTSGTVNRSGEIRLDPSTPFADTGEYITDGLDGDLLYQVRFDSDVPLSDRVLFPAHASEGRGMEDARFVQFSDGTDSRYFATYTAYDGSNIVPQFIETLDFLNFNVGRLNGGEVSHKGLALFPRKIGGKYAMLSRQDNENNYIMFSDDLRQWDHKELLLEPKEPWEFVLVGNCGSPIETEHGWLVIHHGVGPMRTYTISAFLLDLEDPRKVIGRLTEPILLTDGEDRDGYVPNAVYSCGSILNGDQLIVPYAAADYVTEFAVASVKELLEELLASGH